MRIQPMVGSTCIKMNHALMLASCKRLAYNANDGTIFAMQNNSNAISIIIANGGITVAIAYNTIKANPTKQQNNFTNQYSDLEARPLNTAYFL